jgi:Zn-dependent protease
MREAVRWSVAFHEARHAVVAWRRGFKVHGATIVPSLDFLAASSTPIRCAAFTSNRTGRAVPACEWRLRLSCCWLAQPRNGGLNRVHGARTMA